MKKTAQLGLFTALALIFSYLESLIPLPISIPGIKLGLANLVIVVAMYMWGIGEAAAINIARVLLAGLLFGNLTSILYSLSGAVLSLVCMYIVYRLLKLHIVTVCVCGSVGHIIGQLSVATFAVGAGPVASYLPVLLLSSFIAGIIVGLLSQIIVKRLKMAGSGIVDNSGN